MKKHSDKYRNIPSVSSIDISEHKNAQTIINLLKLFPYSSREIKQIIGQVESFPSIQHFFEKIFSVNLTNKELIFFMSVINSFKECVRPELLLEKVTFSYDEHTQSALYLYFSTIFNKYENLSYENKSTLFVIFINIFETGSQYNDSFFLFQFFSKLLCEEKFLRSFISNKLYLTFPFVKELLVNFNGQLCIDSVKIAYEIPRYRKLVYSLYTQDASDCSHTWLLYNQWTVDSIDDIPLLFINNIQDVFTSTTVYEISESRIDWYDEQLSSFLSRHSEFSDLEMSKYSSFMNQMIEKKRKFKELIVEFNESRNFDSLLEFCSEGGKKSLVESFIPLRLSDDISLAALGDVLCKEKNEVYLKKWFETFSLESLDILEGLRLCLGSFVMGGESQIIGRVITSYVDQYFLQNRDSLIDENADKSLATYFSEDECRKAHQDLAYSLVLLNTMLHNPNVDRKMSFSEYHEKLQMNENMFTEEKLRKFYSSVKKQEIKMPEKIFDTFDRFLLYRKFIQERKDAFSPEKHLVAFRHAFLSNLDNFYLIGPVKFYRITVSLGIPEVFVQYLLDTAVSMKQYFDGYKIYLENFKVAKLPEELNVVTFFKNLVKIQKPKSKSVFRSMFGASESKKKYSMVVSSYVSAYNDLLALTFSDQHVFVHNVQNLLDTLSEFFSQGGNNSLVSDFVHHVVVANFIKYIDIVDDKILSIIFHKIPTDFQYKILKVNFRFFEMVESKTTKLNFIKNFIAENSAENVAVVFGEFFKSTENFEIFYLFSSAIPETSDFFYDVIHVHCDMSNTKSCVNFTEYRFGGQLSDSVALLRFFTINFHSILNTSFTRNIHQNVKSDEFLCPMRYSWNGKNPFMCFDQVAYLLCKSYLSGDSNIYNFSIVVLRYLSKSLVLFSLLIEYLIDNEFSINGEEISINIKILLKILLKKLGEKDLSVCCPQYTDGSALEGVYNKVCRLNILGLENIQLLRKLLMQYKNSVAPIDI